MILSDTTSMHSASLAGLGASISGWVDRAALVLCAVLILVMLSLSLVGIGHQVLFDEALVWSTSLTRLFLPWVAMLSITVAFKHGEHIALTLAVDCLPPALLRALLVINLVVVGLFSIALVWYGLEFFEFSTQRFMVSESIQLSHRWTAASIPVAGCILCVHLLSGFDLVRHADPLKEI